MSSPKTYVYHVYKNNTFKGVLNNVISDFAYQQELNSAGSTITINLGTTADSFSEGSLIDFNNDIQIYEIDDNNTNGSLIFRGYIVNYQPIFGDNNQEQVVLTVMGYGATLNDYIIETGSTIDVNQSSSTGNSAQITGAITGTAQFTDVIQSFTTGAGITKLSSIQLQIAANTLLGDVGNSVFLQLCTNRTDAENGGPTTTIATATQVITSTTSTVYSFTFATAVTVTANTQYFVLLSYNASDHSPSLAGGTYGGIFLLAYNNTSPLAGQFLESCTSISGAFSAPVSISGSAYILTYTNTGNTNSPYSSQDPSAILKSIIDNYNFQGGKITYTAASIDMTGTTVSYTFNTNTVLEGVNKCLTMAPVGWYWYIDQPNNVLHFHKVSSTSSHTFTFNKNIKNLTVDKRTQDLVNIVYFVGGPIAGVNLYQKYVLQTSVDLYGRHAIRYSDNNVTLASTAQIIANSILSNQGQVELRIELDILDDGGQGSSGLGFDIESIIMGESVSFRSLGPSRGGTLWDVAKWDVAKWDFDITDLSSIVVQVTKIDYTPDILHLSLSTVPPDITKRVQDIYRNLSQVNTLNNPAAPS